MEEEVIYNRFEQVLNEWICLHYEEVYFKGRDNTRPQIKLCGQTLRIRANDAWSKMPVELKEATVAHEQGHREYNHASILQDNPFYRLGCVLNGGVDKKELEADRYAAKLIGAAEYIRRLEQYIALYPPESTTQALEFRYRIKALREANERR